jgi:hypothetical protein
LVPRLSLELYMKVQLRQLTAGAVLRFDAEIVLVKQLVAEMVLAPVLELLPLLNTRLLKYCHRDVPHKSVCTSPVAPTAVLVLP